MISIIVAMGKNRVIGKNGKLPWHIPEDLKHFKKVTFGHAVIMGRKTFESIGRPLPGRRNIIVTRNASFRPAGVTVAHSVDEALSVAGAENAFIIGGAELYQQSLDRADRLYLTLVEGEFDGDTFFPSFDLSAFQILEEMPLSSSPSSRCLVAQRKTSETLL